MRVVRRLSSLLKRKVRSLRRSSTGSVSLRDSAVSNNLLARFAPGDKVLVQELEGSTWTFASIKRVTKKGYEVEFSGRQRHRVTVNELQVAPAPIVGDDAPNTPPKDVPELMRKMSTPGKKPTPSYFIMK